MEKKKIFDVGQYIGDEFENLEIPESLEPENMRLKLENVSRKKKVDFKKWTMPLATAACMVILISAGIYTQNMERYVLTEEKVSETNAPVVQTEIPEVVEEAEKNDLVAVYNADKEFYDKVYDLIDDNRGETADYEVYYGGEIMEDGTSVPVGGIAESTTSTTTTAGGAESTGTSSSTSINYSSSATSNSADRGESETGSKDYYQTNVQVEFVDEGDIVKNDGRYLYQLIEDGSQQIQIIDTKDELRTASFIEGFSEISEFYVSGDTLVVIENLWAVEDSTTDSTLTDTQVSYSYAYNNTTSFCYIHFYDISDRTAPKEINKFTIKGSYKTSRISDGFLYFLSGYDTKDTDSREDLNSYIPIVEGEVLGKDSIYLPEQCDAVNYLMMVSVDVSDPTEFTDKMAVISAGNYYYVSEKNIYVLDYVEGKIEEGIVCDKTEIIKFSYEKGDIEPVAEGAVNGTVLDQFAMDEHEGFFRMITTVSPYEAEEVINNIDGKSLGYHITKWLPESNSVYVLDDTLSIAGKIEGLAEDEMVYSARFMGDTGYFVTFRQTDPLFSVDFSNPYKPKILGELKISGFSEYLHFYDENLLLGIGYEADEETGRTKGIKLSMFDISDPKDVKEIHKLVLDNYDYSDAFYNHNAVMVSSGKNVIGFAAYDYTGKNTREYGVYSYDFEKGFIQKYKFDCSPNSYSYETRGTYIEDTFYLLKQTYGVEAYDINTGELLDKLSMTESLAQ